MTRGRKPLIALDEAGEIGGKRGPVLPTPGKREDYFDLVLYENWLTVFVRVKRSITHISDPREILATYRREIIRLRKVPLNAVVAREIWVRSPRGSWQFFRLLVDQIVEIRQNGTIIEEAIHSLAVLDPTVKVSKVAASPVAKKMRSVTKPTGESNPTPGEPNLPSKGD